MKAVITPKFKSTRKLKYNVGDLLIDIKTNRIIIVCNGVEFDNKFGGTVIVGNNEYLVGDQMPIGFPTKNFRLFEGTIIITK